MNTYAYFSILTFILPLLLAIFLCYKGRRNFANFLFGIVCFFVALWGFSAYKFSTTSSKKIAFLWWQIGYIGPILNPVIYYHFVISFLKLKQKFYKKILFFVYLAGIIFVIFDLFFKEIFLGDLRWVFGQFYCLDWVKQKSIVWLVFYISFWWVLLIYSFLLVLEAYKSSSGIRKSQLRYLILGSAIGWIGGHIAFLPAFHIDIYPYGSSLLLAFYPFIIAYAIVKYRLMDIRVAITRAGIFLVLYTAVLGLPFYVGYQTKSWLISASFAAVFATLGPIIYPILQKKTEDILLAQQRHYQQILLQAAGGMTREHNLNRLFKLIVYIVKKTVKVKFAAIFAYDRQDKIYTLKAARDSNTIPKNITFNEDSPLISYIKDNPSPFIPEEIPSTIREILKDKLGRPFGLLVPSVIEHNLIGFLVLGEKLDKTVYSQDDINVFKILSHQTSLAIENCIFFDEFKKAQNKIFEAEKLASIGGMADGVAHQIKNRLNHFSVASGELKFEINEFIRSHPDLVENNPDLKKTFDYLLKIADSLIANVKHTDGVIRGILNFACVEEKDTLFSRFSLQEIVDLSLDLLKIKHKIARFPLEVKIKDSDEIYGVKAQLMECIYNILDNSYEAIQEKIYILNDKEKKKFNPFIKLELIHTSKSSLIKISDNGIGIKQEDKPRIFAPFFTTKSSYKSGTGIGMYVVKRIIEENHKGKIWFKSEYMKGTTFFIELPKDKTNH
jgi:signal transduction histidine kinase